ncbi:hypothetical protein O6H91_08G088800 [Diphasiastrum complanatum]|uniref:Uncharacterized protein n=1 Tax=Diphasiastrum complanatum TaxID=34168 RepID=A0ACC2CZX8_DIPCM|nr:hypothetical protein O6H91_08G088800 [Diphasiastrum complanatum]
MLLNTDIESSRFMLFKSSSDSFCFKCRSCVRSVLWISLFLALCLLQCFEAVADDQHSVAGSEPVASRICPLPTLTDLLLSRNNGLEPVLKNFARNKYAEVANTNVAAPSRILELNETTLDQALALLRSNGTFMMVLFYADWCPFSKELLPTYEVLSSLFPSVYHVAVEGTNLRSSVLSKYGVHSFPLLFLYNKASRERYQGTRALQDLIIFLKNATGVKPLNQENSAGTQIGRLSDFVKETDLSKEFCPFSQGRKWLQNDTYLILATWFLVLRVLLPFLPWASSKLKRFWNRCHVHLFAKLRFSNLFKEKPGRGTFTVEIAELKSRYFARRWSKPLFS